MAQLSKLVFFETLVEMREVYGGNTLHIYFGIVFEAGFSKIYTGSCVGLFRAFVATVCVLLGFGAQHVAATAARDLRHGQHFHVHLLCVLLLRVCCLSGLHRGGRLGRDKRLQRPDPVLEPDVGEISEYTLDTTKSLSSSAWIDPRPTLCIHCRRTVL